MASDDDDEEIRKPNGWPSPPITCPPSDYHLTLVFRSLDDQIPNSAVGTFKWQIFYIFEMEITVKKNPDISNQITISFTLVKLRWFVSRAAGSIHNRLDNLKYYSDMLSFAEFESFYFIMNIFIMKIEVWQ